MEDMTSQLARIASSLESIVKLQSSSLSPLIIVAAGAAIGTALGYASNFLLWKNTEKRKRTHLIIEEINKTTDKFEEMAIDYWLTSRAPEEERKLMTLEIGIKSTFRLLRGNSYLLETHLIKNEKLRGLISELKEEISNLYDAATGDTFEAANHISSPTRATKISSINIRIRTSLVKISAKQA